MIPLLEITQMQRTCMLRRFYHLSHKQTQLSSYVTVVIVQHTPLSFGHVIGLTSQMYIQFQTWRSSMCFYCPLSLMWSTPTKVCPRKWRIQKEWGNKYHILIHICRILKNGIKWSESHSVISDSLRPHGLHGPWNSPCQNTRILEWVAGPFSRGSSQPSGWTQVSCTAGGFFTSICKAEIERQT